MQKNLALKARSALLLALFALSPPTGFAQKKTYRYVETTGASVIELERTIEIRDEGISLTYAEGDAAESTILRGRD